LEGEDQSDTEPLAAASALTLASRKLERLSHRVVAIITIYGTQGGLEGVRKGGRV